MRRAWLILLFSVVASAQSTLTTLTGTIRDLSGSVVTSGRITFTLNAPDSTIPGTGRFTPATAYCKINASGSPVSNTDGVSPCVVASNTALTPSGTSYAVCIQAYLAQPGGCFNFFALAGQTIDISTIAPTLTTLPTNYSGIPGPPGPQGVPGPTGGCTTFGTGPCVSSVSEAYVSQIGCAQGVDLAVGTVRGTFTPPTDAAPCINAWLAANVIPGKQVAVLHNDGQSAISGIAGPKGGGWSIVSDIKPGMETVAITGYSITSNVVTFATNPQTLIAGQAVIIKGFPTSTFLNGNNGLPLLIATATSTSFTASAPYFTHANVSNTPETGVGLIPTGDGFYQINGSAGHIIQNGPATNANICPGGYMDPGYNNPYSAVPSLGGPISIVNQFINGNMANVIAPTGTFAFGQPYCYNTGIAILDTDGVNLRGDYIYNTNNYNVYLRNVRNFNVQGDVITPYGLGLQVTEANLDGIHASGPFHYGDISSNIIASGDDAVALNCGEGWLGDGCSDVNVHDDELINSLSPGRLYTASQNAQTGYPITRAKHIHFYNEHGTVAVGYHIGLEGGPTLQQLDTLADISFSNISLYAGNVAGYPACGITIAENIADISFSNFALQGAANSCSYMNSYSFFNFYGNATIRSLSVSAATMRRIASATWTAAPFNFVNGSSALTIQKASVNNFRVVDVDGSSGGTVSSLFALNSASTIGNLCTSSIDQTNITSIASMPSQIASYCPSLVSPGAPITSSNVSPATGITVNSANGFDANHLIVFTTGSGTFAPGSLYTFNYPSSRPHGSFWPFCTVGAASTATTPYTGGLYITGSASSYTLYTSTSIPTSTTLSVSVVCPLP